MKLNIQTMIVAFVGYLGVANAASLRGGNRTLVASNSNGVPGGNRTLLVEEEENGDLFLHRTMKRDLATSEISNTMGGGGGRAFGRFNPSSIQLRSGSELDAIILDGIRYGGGGGSESNTIELREGEYINSFEIRAGSIVDSVRFTTNMGQSVEGGGGGGTVYKRDQIQVTGISGRYGSRVDQLTIYYKFNENAVRTLTLGGQGGTAFDQEAIYHIGLRGGSLVDSITLNGDQYGGNGGGNIVERFMQPNEYINNFSVRANSLIDNLRFSTTKGRTISAGGTGGTLYEFSNVRLISIGGRRGSLLDQVKVTYIDNYNPSSLVESGATIFYGARGEGKHTEIIANSFTKTQSVFKASEFAVTAGVEAEFYGTVSTSLQTSYSTSTQNREELTKHESSTRTTEFTVPPGQALIELTTGDVYRSTDGTAWVAPSGNDARYDTMDARQFSSFLSNGKKVVDLGGYVRSIFNHTSVAKLDPTFSSNNQFDVYIAK